MDKNLNPNIEPSEKQKSIVDECFELIDKMEDAKKKELLAFVKGVAFFSAGASKSKAS